MRTLLCCLILILVAACESTDPMFSAGPGQANVIGIQNTRTESKPEYRLMDPGLQQLTVIGVDNQRVEQGLFLEENQELPYGPRILTILSVDDKGRETISYMPVTLENMGTYRLKPMETEEGLLARLVDEDTGEVVAVSSPEPVQGEELQKIVEEKRAWRERITGGK